MKPRRELFPHVIEMNHQARRQMGCCVYLVHDGDEWALIDIGYTDTLEDIVGIIRQLDFPLAQCKYLVATHADVDHIQGLKRAKEMMPQAQVIGHPHAAKLISEGERIMTYAEISAQGISIDLPPIAFDRTINEGDILEIGSLKPEVWRQHLPRRVCRQYRRPSWFRHSRLHPFFEADSGERCGMAPPQPRACFQERQRPSAEDDRPAGVVSAHGRFRNLCCRLATPRRMGRRTRPQLKQVALFGPREEQFSN